MSIHGHLEFAQAGSTRRATSCTVLLAVHVRVLSFVRLCGDLYSGTPGMPTQPRPSMRPSTATPCSTAQLQSAAD